MFPHYGTEKLVAHEYRSILILTSCNEIGVSSGVHFFLSSNVIQN
jgi:hypothetical protein